jgi:hypothetical protein
MKCPYCKGQVKYHRDTRIIYGNKANPVWGGVWICENYPKCDSYVGCHKGTTEPLGRMADKELRKYKVLAHNEFDKLWKQGDYTRAEAYKIMQKLMCLPEHKAHIGLFTVKKCKQLINKLEQYKGLNETPGL